MGGFYTDLTVLIFIGFIPTSFVGILIHLLTQRLDGTHKKNYYVEPAPSQKSATTDNRDFLVEPDSSLLDSDESIEQINDTPSKNGLAAHRINDREYVLWSVRQDASNLSLIPEKFRSDKAIVLAAMNFDPTLVALANDSLKENGDFIKECWSRCPSREIYEMFKRELGSTFIPPYRDSVLGTLKAKNRKTFLNNHMDILKDNSYLSDDKEIVLAAIKLNPFDLQYASVRVRADKEVVLAAIRALKTPLVDYIGFIPETLKTDEDILRAEKEVVLAAINHNAVNIRYASASLKDDKEFVLAAISALKYPLEDYTKFVPEGFKTDEDILQAIARNNTYDEDSIW